MICPACHSGNEDDARFCKACGQLLDTLCPACGSPSKAEARFCRTCGHHLSPPSTPSQPFVVQPRPSPRLPSLDDRLDQLQRYLPAHLADKILANCDRLAGERKVVTVLFVDIAGYTGLGAALGEEALFALMDELFELLIHEVHRYEGTVNELTGDGLVAFSAPRWPGSRLRSEPYGRRWPCKRRSHGLARRPSMRGVCACNCAWGSILGR